MQRIKTTHDLNMAVAELIVKRSRSPRSLEDYLLCLWRLARRYRERPSFSLDNFFRMISDAFTNTAPDFEPAWREVNAQEMELVGFAGWEATMTRQIVDLREMKEEGILSNDDRFVGVDSPRGNRWYNFDPCSFLECATDMTYGNEEAVVTLELPESKNGELEPELLDETEEAPVPVAVEEKETVGTPGVSWNDFRKFLLTGQLHE